MAWWRLFSWYGGSELLPQGRGAAPPANERRGGCWERHWLCMERSMGCAPLPLRGSTRAATMPFTSKQCVAHRGLYSAGEDINSRQTGGTAQNKSTPCVSRLQSACGCSGGRPPSKEPAGPVQRTINSTRVLDRCLAHRLGRSVGQAKQSWPTPVPIPPRLAPHMLAPPEPPPSLATPPLLLLFVRKPPPSLLPSSPIPHVLSWLSSLLNSFSPSFSCSSGAASTTCLTCGSGWGGMGWVGGPGHSKTPQSRGSAGLGWAA